MRKFHNKAKDSGYLIYRLLRPFYDPLFFFPAFPRYFRFLKDRLRYSRLPGAEKMGFRDTYPQIHESTETTAFDHHYFYQDIWAFKKIYASGAKSHVDVASRIDFVGFLSAFCKVIFIDIRPLIVNLENFECKKGDILDMPFADNRVESLSTLHVAEHIGLGRYGDPLDPEGTKKACQELARVLAPGGNLYFSLPIGRPRLCFNAYRIHSPQQILDYFSDLRLVELSGIDDKGNFACNIDRKILDQADYGCGLFHFTKD